MRIYEGMFVLDDGRCNEHWDAVVKELRGLLEKNGADIFTCERWDERRLAYPIRGHNRAVYLLTRFTAPTENIAPLERECRLNDTILRVLFVRDTRSEKLHQQGLLDPKGSSEPEAEEGEGEQAAQDTEQPKEGAPEAPPAPQGEAPEQEQPEAAPQPEAPKQEQPEAGPPDEAQKPAAEEPAGDAPPPQQP